MGDTFFRVELRDSVYIALVEDYFDRVLDDSNVISHWQLLRNINDAMARICRCF